MDDNDFDIFFETRLIFSPIPHECYKINQTGGNQLELIYFDQKIITNDSALFPNAAENDGILVPNSQEEEERKFVSVKYLIDYCRSVSSHKYPKFQDLSLLAYVVFIERSGTCFLLHLTDDLVSVDSENFQLNSLLKLKITDHDETFPDDFQYFNCLYKFDNLFLDEMIACSLKTVEKYNFPNYPSYEIPSSEFKSAHLKQIKITNQGYSVFGNIVKILSFDVSLDERVHFSSTFYFSDGSEVGFVTFEKNSLMDIQVLGHLRNDGPFECSLLAYLFRFFNFPKSVWQELHDELRSARNVHSKRFRWSHSASQDSRLHLALSSWFASSQFLRPLTLKLRLSERQRRGYYNLRSVRRSYNSDEKVQLINVPTRNFICYDIS